MKMVWWDKQMMLLEIKLKTVFSRRLPLRHSITSWNIVFIHRFNTSLTLYWQSYSRMKRLVSRGTKFNAHLLVFYFLDGRIVIEDSENKFQAVVYNIQTVLTLRERWSRLWHLRVSIPIKSKTVIDSKVLELHFCTGTSMTSITLRLPNSKEYAV